MIVLNPEKLACGMTQVQILNNGVHIQETKTLAKPYIYLRVEGSLLASDPSRAIFHFSRNSQAFTERIYRLLTAGAAALGVPRRLQCRSHGGR